MIKLPSNHLKPWTDSEKEELRTMLDAGTTHKVIAKHFKRTEAAIGFAKQVFIDNQARPVTVAKPTGKRRPLRDSTTGKFDLQGYIKKVVTERVDSYLAKQFA